VSATSSAIFVALVLLPAVHAELLQLVRSDRAMRILARAGAGAALMLGLVLAVRLSQRPHAEWLSAELAIGPRVQLRFGVDALSAPLLPLLGLLTLSMLIGGPRSMLGRAELRALLWLESLTLLTLTTLDLAVLAAGFTLVLIPAHRLTASRDVERRAVSRVFKLYHGLGAAMFVSAVLLIAFYTGRAGDPRPSLANLDGVVVPEGLRPLAFWLLALSALVRMGIAPLHSWLPVSFERGSLLAVTLLVSIRTGFYVLSRLAIAVFPEAARGATPFLVGVALASALYGALGALGQRDLRRLLAFFVISQSGIMLTGLVLGDAHAVSGALLYWLGFAVATTGLMLVVCALYARLGTADMRRLGGLVRVAPQLSTAFFLFGLATIALPGTVAFVAEDMLVHGALEAHPLLTTLMVIAMVLNAITLVRAFAQTFLGEHRGPLLLEGFDDLLPRERVTAVTLLLALIGAGLFPDPLVTAQSPAAHRIAKIEHGEGPTPKP
jgi:NADH-quinone oxidoreductase subunit M